VKRDVPQAVQHAATQRLAPLERWFADNGWNAFEFQREVWQAYLDGESGLVHSATGSGKTLAAWLGPLAEWMSEQNSPTPLGEGRGEGQA
jgi:ATP-dependent Lhr-like helicase